MKFAASNKVRMDSVEPEEVMIYELLMTLCKNEKKKR